jgi:hypothetical protein
VKKFLLATAAIALIGTAPQAGAQTSHPEIYMQQDDQGSWRMFGPEWPEGQEVLFSEGQRPADCPAGAYFIEKDMQTDQYSQVRGCDTETAFDVSPMPSDMMTASGEPFGTPSTANPGQYEDTYLVTPRAD